MVKVGTVSLLFYSPITGRTNATSLALDTLGILDDKHYNKSLSRSVLLTSLSSYTLARVHDIEMNHGMLGENILIDYNPYHLETGKQLKIGTAIVEISQACTLCESLNAIDDNLAHILKEDRGVFAKVVEAGEVNEGCDVYLLG